MNSSNPDATMAVFLDLENIALGAHDAHYPRFDIQKVLERLLVKGHIVVKKAYCDFDRYKAFKRDLHEAAFELIEIPHVRQSGKNSADIRMVVDALDLCYTKGHVDTFVILSGDSDFSPLVSKLRENAKRVVGVGVKNSSSDLFINNCDEFLYYDDLVRTDRTRGTRRRGGSTAGSGSAGAGSRESARDGAREAAREGTRETGRDPVREGDSEGDREAGEETPVLRDAAPSKSLSPDKAVEQVVETFEIIREERDEDDMVWGSMIKQAIKRRNPGFNERAHGFRSFNDILIEAQKRGLLKLEADEKSGGYVVTGVD